MLKSFVNSANVSSLLVYHLSKAHFAKRLEKPKALSFVLSSKEANMKVMGSPASEKGT